MRPILYSSSEAAFDTNGIGILSDATKCNVAKELNGKCELVLQYPANGVHRKSIVRRSIISAKPDPLSKPQPFRVYRTVPSSNGTLTAYARHLAYDLIGITISPFAAIGAVSALAAIPGNATTACPFTFWTDKSSSTAFNLSTPRSVWKLLGGEAGSILDTFGGEYEFDGYTVRLWNRLGADRGVQIRYGKNLTSLEQDENCANCYTAIHPYWAGTDGKTVQLVQLPERIVNAPGTYDHTRILPVDFSTEWPSPPSEEELRKRAKAYIADNNIGMPDVSLSVQFVHLDQTEEYKNRAILERVVLGDTCDVFFPDMSVTSSSRVVATDYDVLRDAYNSVTLGKVKASIAQTLVQQNKDLEQKPSLSTVQQISMQLTARIMGARGGAARLLDTDGDGLPDELYIADNNDPAQALRVWRFNHEGWAASSTGYNGPFILGATLEDGILARTITAANLVAGTIQSKDGSTFFLDLDSGILRMKAIDNINNSLTEIQSDLAGVTLRVSATEDVTGDLHETTEQLKEDMQTKATVQQLTEVKTAADGLRVTVSEVQTVLDGKADQAEVTEITEHFIFGAEGLTITNSGTGMGINISEKKVSFSGGTDPTTVIKPNEMETTNLQVQEQLGLGEFAFIPRPNGNLSFRYMGG